MPPRKSKRVKTDALPESGSSSIIQASLPNEIASPIESESGEKRNAYNPFEGIPLDVLGEPLDLLHLARTSKQLRRELMNPCSRVFWKRSAATVEGLPPCPKDMPDPQYAEFMFSSHCQRCFRDDKTILTYMNARVQLCGKCSPIEFKLWKDLPKAVDKALSKLVPSTTKPFTKAEKKKLADSEASTKKKTPSLLRFHVKSAMKLHRKFSKLESEEQKAAWLKQQRTIWRKVEKHAEACSKFAHIQHQKEVARAKRVKQKRMEQIEDELRISGYWWKLSKSLLWRDVPHGPIGRSHVYKDHELTEKEWEEMSDDMINWMEELEELGLKEAEIVWTGIARRQEFSCRVNEHIAPTYSLYVSSHPQNSPIPTLSEVVLVLLPLLEDIFIFDGEDPPEGALDAVLAEIPQVIADWKDNLEETLLDIIRKSGDHPGPISREILPYASTTFQCQHCHNLLTYPAVGNHPCLFRELYEIHGKKKPLKNSPHAEVDPEQSLSKDFFSGELGDARVWYPASGIVFHESGYRHTLAALDTLGLEHTTTAEVLLQRLNPYIECLCECYHPQPRVAMRVSQALNQCHHHTSGTFEGSFAAISEESLKAYDGYKKNSQSYDAYCIWCHQRPNTAPGEYHFTWIHDMDPDEEEKNEDEHVFLVRGPIDDTRIYIPPQ